MAKGTKGRSDKRSSFFPSAPLLPNALSLSSAPPGFLIDSPPTPHPSPSSLGTLQEESTRNSWGIPVTVRRILQMEAAATEAEGEAVREARINQSINHGGYTPGGALPRLPYGAIPGGHASRVPMQAPFLYRVTPSRRHRLAAGTSSVGVL